METTKKQIEYHESEIKRLKKLLIELERQPIYKKIEKSVEIISLNYSTDINLSKHIKPDRLVAYCIYRTFYGQLKITEIAKLIMVDKCLMYYYVNTIDDIMSINPKTEKAVKELIKQLKLLF